MSGLDPSKCESSALQGSYGWTDTLKGVYYGLGSVNTALPKLHDTLGAKKALIVTGKSLYQKVSLQRSLWIQRLTSHTWD
jgi:hypothetical protein